jgi:hypothetical protein
MEQILSILEHLCLLDWLPLAPAFRNNSKSRIQGGKLVLEGLKIHYLAKPKYFSLLSD